MLAGGRADGIASSLGTGLGGMVHVAGRQPRGLGGGADERELFTALKLRGSRPISSGWACARSARRPGGERPRAARVGEDAAAGPRRAFREGAVVEALNPKTAAFFLAFIPQFVDPSAGPVALAVPCARPRLGALNTTADIVIAFAASQVRAGAATRPVLVRRLREGSGLAMVASGSGSCWRGVLPPDRRGFAERPASLYGRAPQYSSMSLTRVAVHMRPTPTSRAACQSKVACTPCGPAISIRGRGR